MRTSIKQLLTLILIPFAALGINPSEPVVRLHDGQIVERRMSIPARFPGANGIIVNYDKADDYLWYKDGWRQARINVVTTTNVIEIPAAIQAVEAAYKSTLEGIYGEGATTNEALTREYVAIDLSLRPPEEVSADTGLRLSTWFEVLNSFWGRGEVWTYPYGATSYTNTTTQEVWEVLP